MKDAEKRKAALAMVRAAGLDVDTIRVVGIDEDGYDEFILNAEGKRVYSRDIGAAATVRREWPEGFPVAEFLRLIRECGYYDDELGDIK